MSVILRDIFKNDILRRINGVISAGKSNEEDLNIEFSEYVVTADVSKSLDEFFMYYNEMKPQKNGVWLSGFFGSGKSHLLKMLSYLLENASISGRICLSYFEQKLSEDPIRLANLRKGCSIPSESVLFNIIQNNQVDRNGKSESILPIFLRQFYDHCGYYGADFIIAEIERELDSEELLPKFISHFEEISGKQWCEARKKKNLNVSSIVKAYAGATGQREDANLLQNYSPSTSINDFATRVKEYIDTKGKGFRLNFFVDEAGQFVVKDARLMVELQEVATALSDKCDNRAWVIVTSQDQLDKFIGAFENRGTIKKDDVSKIQGRFYVKLKLTNQNVNEVIQKRLLAKNYDGKQLSSVIYSSQKDNFNALFGFVNGPKTFRNYKDETEFVNTYPFVTYQFDLFKTAFTELSAHGAFPGEYTSTGTRSLLDIFHRVLNNLANGQYSSSNYSIVPFDAFYEGIEDNLMENFKQSIFLAENNLGDSNPYALRVLKAMLLVKYIPKDFKSTVHNIAALLLSGFDDKTDEIMRMTQDSLNLLEAQTYIQRKNSEEYDFLTNNEKDIETEIKNEDISDDAIYDFLNTSIFKRSLASISKAKDSSGNTFPITKQIDDRALTAKQDLGLVIATAYAENLDSAQLRYSHSDLVVIMKDDGKLFRDITLTVQTDNYFRKHDVNMFSAEKKLVADQKRMLNSSRKENIDSSIQQILQSAEIFISGQSLAIKTTSNYKARIETALSELVEKVYINLPMISGRLYNDATVSAAFTNSIDEDIFGTVPEAERQIISKVEFEKRRGSNSTVKSLVDYFGKIPYGWPDQAVIYTLVMLFRKGKIEVKQNSLELQIDKLKALINQTTQWTNLIVETTVEIDAGKIKRVRNYINDLSAKQCSSDNAKGVALSLTDALKEKLSLISRYSDTTRYPFLKTMDRAKEIINDSLGKNTAWYFESFLGDESDELLDLAEDVIIPCISFMQNSELIEKFTDAYDALKKHALELDESNRNLWGPIKEILDDPKAYSNHDVSSLPNLCLTLEQFFSGILSDFKTDSLRKVSTYRSSLKDNPDYSILDDGLKKEVEDKIQSWEDAVVRAPSKKDVGSVMYFNQSSIDSYISVEASKARAPKPETTPDAEPPVKPMAPPKSRNRAISTLNTIAYQSSDISTPQDIDAFVEKLKAEMLKTLEDGYIIGR